MQNLLPLVFVLACPIGMGLMMWLLMGNHKEQTSSDAVVEPTPQTPILPSRPSPLKAIWDCVQMCLNWKVLAILSVIAVLVGVIAPQFFWGTATTLLVLVCPLSMAIMMFSMSRKQGSAGSGTASCCEPAPAELPQIQEERDGERSSVSEVEMVGTHGQ